MITFHEPKESSISFPKAYRYYDDCDRTRLIVLFLTIDRGIILKNGLAPLDGAIIKDWDPLGTLNSKDQPVWIPIDVTISH